MFGIDCAEIYRKNVKFYKLIDNPRVSSHIMAEVSIAEISVYRRNTLEPDAARELIISSEDIVGLRVEPAETDIASIREVYIQGSESSVGNYRFFSVTDKEISDFTSGKYEYSIEINFLDKTQIEIGNTKEYFIDDGWHPSVFAHKKWSNVLYNYLGKLQ